MDITRKSLGKLRNLDLPTIRATITNPKQQQFKPNTVVYDRKKPPIPIFRSKSTKPAISTMRQLTPEACIGKEEKTKHQTT